MSVVALQVAVIFTQLVEARGFDEHARVGSGEASDREDTHDCGSDNTICIVQRDRDFGQAAVGLTAHEHDVVPFFETQRLLVMPRFVRVGRRL